MGTPYLGEIRLISFDYAPRGWAFCNGQAMSIKQNQALFALLGTTYGGNGQTTFALPNLQSRIPIHFSSDYPQGSMMGEETHTLTLSEIPSHNHALTVSGNPASSSSPSGLYPAVPDPAIGNAYYLAPDCNMHPQAVRSNNGGQPHNNLMPYLVMNYVIALQGIFPSRN